MSLLLTVNRFHVFSSISIVDLEQVNTGLDITKGANDSSEVGKMIVMTSPFFIIFEELLLMQVSI